MNVLSFSLKQNSQIQTSFRNSQNFVLMKKFALNFSYSRFFVCFAIFGNIKHIWDHVIVVFFFCMLLTVVPKNNKTVLKKVEQDLDVVIFSHLSLGNNNNTLSKYCQQSVDTLYDQNVERNHDIVCEINTCISYFFSVFVAVEN